MGGLVSVSKHMQTKQRESAERGNSARERSLAYAYGTPLPAKPKYKTKGLNIYMAGGVDKTKIRRKPKHEWVAWSPEQKERRRTKYGWNNYTWSAERARVQALADAAAPKTKASPATDDGLPPWGQGRAEPEAIL